MRKAIIGVSSLLALLVLLAVPLFAARSGSDTLYNASFEAPDKSDPTLPASWVRVDNPLASALRQSVQVHSGLWAMRYQSASPDSVAQVVSRMVPVTPTRQYELDAFALSGITTDRYLLDMGITWYDRAQHDLDAAGGTSAIPTTSWAPYHYRQQAPAAAAFATVWVGLSGNQDPVADLYIDDVTFGVAQPGSGGPTQ